MFYYLAFRNTTIKNYHMLRHPRKNVFFSNFLQLNNQRNKNKEVEIGVVERRLKIEVKKLLRIPLRKKR